MRLILIISLLWSAEAQGAQRCDLLKLGTPTLALAQALGRCGLRSAAAACLLQISERGGAPALAAFDQLALLTLRPQLGAKSSQKLRRALDQPRVKLQTRRVLRRWMAREAIARSAYASALALLDEPQDAHGAFLKASIAVRRGDLAGALRLFLQSHRAARVQQRQELAELAALNLARLTSARQPQRATQIYREIPYGSPYFGKARQELSWLWLRLRRPRRALGESFSLKAPAARSARIDGAVVEAASLLALCRRREAVARARQGLARLGTLRAGVVSFLRRRPEVRLYYVHAMATLAKKGSELDPLLGRALLAEDEFRRDFRRVWALQRERGRLHEIGGALERALSAELDRKLIRAQQQAGETVRRVLSTSLREIDELRRLAEEIIFETYRGARQRPRRVVAKPGRVKWPFTGEHWPDEVGHYRSTLRSACR